jgi:hypothetical protein
VYKSVEESEPGNDGWTVKEGLTRYVCSLQQASITDRTSITPLKANFMHGPGEFNQKELEL